MQTPSPLLHFDRCLIRERLVAAMAKARYCRSAGLPADWVASAVHEARCWSKTLVQAHKAARARS